MLEDAINAFEELKKYIFIVNRGKSKKIVIKFNNDNFYHLAGLHKTNINIFFPDYIKTQDKKYKYMKKNLKKFENILKNQIADSDLLISRISTFPNILDLLKSSDRPSLYNLKPKATGSVYNGDFGLLKFYDEKTCCLLGLKIDNETDNLINCAPQSWMASNRINRIVNGRRQSYLESIICIPNNMYKDNNE